MDPPSFTRKFLAIEMHKCGQDITQNEAERYQKVLKEKAQIISAKLEENPQQIVQTEDKEIEHYESGVDLDQAIAMIDEN